MGFAGAGALGFSDVPAAVSAEPIIGGLGFIACEIFYGLGVGVMAVFGVAVFADAAALLYLDPFDGGFDDGRRWFSRLWFDWLGDGEGGGFLKFAVVFVEGELGAAAAVVRILQSRESVGEVLHLFTAVLRIFDVLQGGQGEPHFHDEDSAESFEGIIDGAIVLSQFGVLFAEAVEPFDALLVSEPILISGAAPVGDVLVGDGATGEELGHGGFGFGQGVEPCFDGLDHLAGFEAAIQFVADGFGKAGDFADSCDHKKVESSLC